MAQLKFDTYDLENARDLGGLPLENGAVVKEGCLLRSCSLSQATPAEIEQLNAEYKPAYIIDLRSTGEAEKDPDPLDLLPNAYYSNIPLAADNAVGVVRKEGLREAFQLAERMANEPVELMTSMYTDIVLGPRGRGALSLVFDLLLEAQGQCVLWHCTAGKDRAGIVAALVLFALGASRETVYADYLATNEFMAPYLAKQGKQMRLMPPKFKRGLAVANTADPRFLDAAIQAMEQKCGSVEAYLENALGIDAAKRNALRALYTESPVASYQIAY